MPLFMHPHGEFPLVCTGIAENLSCRQRPSADREQVLSCSAPENLTLCSLISQEEVCVFVSVNVSGKRGFCVSENFCIDRIPLEGSFTVDVELALTPVIPEEEIVVRIPVDIEHGDCAGTSIEPL